MKLVMKTKSHIIHTKNMQLKEQGAWPVLFNTSEMIVLGEYEVLVFFLRELALSHAVFKTFIKFGKQK